MISSSGLSNAQTKMRSAGVPEVAIDVFSRFYGIVSEGRESFVREADIDPLVEVHFLDDIEGSATAELSMSRNALAKTAIIKLNGGLGTSMGMEHAKSLLRVRGEHSFLDVIAGQVLAARATSGVTLPVIFMNSFSTDADTLSALEAYPSLRVDGLPLSMLQNQEPKLRVSDLEPVEYPEDPSLEWCPPGHGDVYTVLQSSGLLDQLIERGYEYLNISNADNLGAYPSPEIAQWFEDSGAPFVAETVQRTPADRKGGHVVVRNGQLILRETAQTHSEDEQAAADISHHRYFNANTLWIRLDALKSLLEEHNGVLPLPLIQNYKTVNPADPASEKVVQLEFAMGAAIELFDGAQALVIDRSRFLPVKTTNDLMLLRSDVYSLGKDFRLRPATVEPLITLDKAVYGFIARFEERFPKGVPSLKDANSLTVAGDWTFGADVKVVGDARLEPDMVVDRIVPDGATISDSGVL